MAHEEWDAREREDREVADRLLRIGSRPVTIDLCERHTTRDDRSVERVIDVDPTPLLLALLRTPRVWPRVVLRAGRAARRVS